MSAPSLRRYRAERLLRRDFVRLRAGVLASARRRLRASGIVLDAGDLDACYAQAWQGLYAVALDGQEIANPAGWLALVTFRRAVDEHRASIRARVGAYDARDGAPYDARETSDDHGANRAQARWPATVADADACDLDAQLDDRATLRALFEALRSRLTARERQAATLCYLQGLSRSEAAVRIGVSDARMRKLMDGAGARRPGVAGKLAALVATIRDGGWCEEQGSLMRGLAYGILDPAGERYRMALRHSDQCPACRAYVRSLRGLSVLLPPVPALLRGLLGALGFGSSRASAGRSAVAHAGAKAGGGAGSAGGGMGAGAGAGAGVGMGGGVAGAAGGVAGTAGGGWLLAGGGVAAKLAVGCLLAAGLGAGCMALTTGVLGSGHAIHRHRVASSARAARRYHPPARAYRASSPATSVAAAKPSAVRTSRASPSSLRPAAKASREFGPEQPVHPAAGTPRSQAARAASASSPGGGGAASAGASESAARTSEGARSRSGGGAAGDAGANPSAAEREFGIE